jgi:3-polyprenyl-4-hydroxybenzoate decarboxylase
MKADRPDEVIHIYREVEPKYEITAIMQETERNGH